MLTVRFAEHFRIRRSEWMLAALMTGLGLAYLTNLGMFADTPAFFANFIAIGPQWAWGAVVTSLGVVRLDMLRRNGRSPISPYIRAGGAWVASLIWSFIFAVSMFNEVKGQSLYFWLIFAGFEVVAAFDAAGDIANARAKRRAENERQRQLGAIKDEWRSERSGRAAAAEPALRAGVLAHDS